MKFKNYVNRYTKDNRIFSKEEISNMSVRDAYGNKKAIISQNRKIGVPSESELRNSSNVIWVNPYRRDDGTEVKGYWRSKTGSISGGIVGDTPQVIMDGPNRQKDIDDILNGKKKPEDVQDVEGGDDEEITPVSATVDLVVALAQIFLKDTQWGEIVEIMAPVLKNIGEKLFGDEDFELDVQDQTSSEPETPAAEPTDSASQSSDPQETLTGGASEVGDSGSDEEMDEYESDEPVVDVSTPEKVQELMFPKEIAGVKRGKEMSFEEVARKGVNPTYEKYIESSPGDGNCHSCTLAYELCRRGYSVNAASVFENETAKKLSHNAFDLWIDPRNGRRCDWQEIDIENETSFNYLEKNIKQGERYELGMYPQLIEDDFDTADGHVVSVERGSDDQLRIYDPQRREYYIGNEQVKLYLYSWIDAPEAVKGIYPKLLRVDDKIINPEYYRTVF